MVDGRARGPAAHRDLVGLIGITEEVAQRIVGGRLAIARPTDVHAAPFAIPDRAIGDERGGRRLAATGPAQDQAMRLRGLAEGATAGDNRIVELVRDLDTALAATGQEYPGPGAM